MIVRKDDFEDRRKVVKDLTDEELKQRFWDLAEQVVDPLVDIARKYTSPAIERSVLLRMGFSSLEAKAIVDKVIDFGLMGKGAGHVVYKASKITGLSIREAGLKLIEGEYWQEVQESFGVSK